MIISISVLFALWLLPQSTISLAQQKQDYGFLVIELFISEGCGASPAAERNMRALYEEYSGKNRPVTLLTFHVDYWNKYGWQDPYSSLAFTRRQNNYASVLKQKEVFTPQVFINGQSAFAGSETGKIKKETERMLKTITKDTLMIKADSTVRDTLWISYTATQANINLTLAVFLVQPEATSNVLKGDNQGKTLTHKNSVRKMDFFPVINKNGSAAIPLRQYKNRSGLYVEAYLQQKQTKRIIAVSNPVLRF
jgi:hypothetical protein